jgi:sugar phosphate isomerase/epimerase
MKARPITLCTAQWTDMPFAEMCAKLQAWGYDGIEIACWGHHLDLGRTDDPAYIEEIKATLAKHELQLFSISAHLQGQCVGDGPDPRLDVFVPAECKGDSEAIREWGVARMKAAARAAKALGVTVVNGFMGSPIWKDWYSFPPTSAEMVAAGYAQIVERWSPIFDVFDACGVRFALEVHPGEIAYDYYSTVRLFEEFGGRPTLGLNFDPSHLVWQGIDPALFFRALAKKVYHVHLKDAVVRTDGLSGILGSHLPFGDLRRGWDFVSLGRGDVDFEALTREANAAGYTGPFSIEWEDNGMEREAGARDALAFAQTVNFAPSSINFDDAMQS